MRSPTKMREVERLQRALKRHPLKRRMPRYNLLGSAGVFVFGFALGTAVIFPLLGFEEDEPGEDFALWAEMFDGFMVGLLWGMLPAFTFLLGSKWSLRRSDREPHGSLLPILLGAVTAIVALGLVVLLIDRGYDPSWLVFGLCLPLGWPAGWLWIRLSASSEG